MSKFSPRFTFLAATVLLLLFAPGLLRAQQQQAGWTPETMMRVRGVGAVSSPPGAVQVSPDNRRVAYTVTETVMTPEKSEFVTQIFVAKADGSETVQITRGEKSSTSPNWSPDGQWLAFTSQRTGKSNVFLLRMSGGEAEQLTDVKTAVNSFAWSPDGKHIAFTTPEAPSADEERAQKGRDDARWVDENVKMIRLYVVPVEKGTDGKRQEPRQLTAGNYSVAETSSGFDWSPDGKTIVFAHSKTPKANDWTTSDVSAVDVATGQAKVLAATAAAEMQPLYAPDGSRVAFIATDNPPRWARSATVNVVPAAGGPAKTFAASFDSQPDLIGWDKSGKRIYFSEARGTGTRLYALDVDADRITELNSTVAVLSGVTLNNSRTMLGFTMQMSDRAPEAHVSALDKFAPVQISRANADLPQLPLGKTESITWKSTDGTEIEGLLTYPVNRAANQKVPLLLVIHGGPAGVFAQTFLGNHGVYPLAAFASRGFAILRANPRGSSGYGEKFRRANLKDWGVGDFQDLMTGVDRVIAMGVADPERLGVMGWSYGGFMTSWTITQTRRFKAASVGAGVTNLMSFTGTADIPSFIPDYFGAQPWEDLEVYRTHSAMFNVKGVVTPTLIQHGEADVRVPISQGYEFYNALKAQNVPTRMLVLPRQPHGPNEPKMRLRAMQSNLDWFEKYLNANAQSRATR